MLKSYRDVIVRNSLSHIQDRVSLLLSINWFCSTPQGKLASLSSNMVQTLLRR